MSLDHTFLQAVLYNPHDDGPRLLYADWLDERGDHDRAEFIRVQCALSREGGDSAPESALQRREQELLERLGPLWSRPLAERGWRTIFRGGLPEPAEAPVLYQGGGPAGRERIRAPRVQIVLGGDPEVNTAHWLELPFVIGVLADLAGMPKNAPKSLKERKFIPIERDNFSKVMAKMEPRLTLHVRNRLTEENAPFDAELIFKQIEDFEPARVAEQLPAVKGLLDSRHKLTRLLSMMEDDGNLERKLEGWLADPEALAAVEMLAAVPVAEEAPELQPEPEETQQSVAATGSAQTPTARDLLEQKIGPSGPPSAKEQAEYKRRWWQCVLLFLQYASRREHVFSRNGFMDVECIIGRWVVEIDEKLSAQLSEVMHDPAFQRLEATWRGLYYLAHNPNPHENLRIMVLNVTKKELLRDLTSVVEFEQSQLFKFVYDWEYGTLGGQPYGLLVGDYQFGNGTEDVFLLGLIAAVAAAVHAPFVANAGSKMFGMDTFAALTASHDLGRAVQGVDYGAWKSFPNSSDSRYVALCLPRVLGRLPYGEKFKRRLHEFNFEESLDGGDRDKYLWMGAAWAYAAVVAAAFVRYGWMARTCGDEDGRVDDDLPVCAMPSDEGGEISRSPCEIALSARRASELSGLGFLPLSHSKGRPNAAFLAARSCRAAEPTAHLDPTTRLDYLLCVSRFVHYMAIIAHQNLFHASVQGLEPAECERSLNRWIDRYVIGPTPCAPGEPSIVAYYRELLARYYAPQGIRPGGIRPLTEARITVHHAQGEQRYHEIIAVLRPWFQLDATAAPTRIVFRIPRWRR